jgi:hypothetical protein
MTQAATENGGMGTAMANGAERQKEAQRGSWEDTVVGDRGIELRTAREMWAFAKMALSARICPKGVDTPEQAFIALEAGLELGLRPLQSLQSIMVVNGRPSLWGDMMLALCQASGELEEYRDWHTGTPFADDWAAHVVVKRKGRESCEKSFSWAQAKRAKLDQKGGTWQQYPDDMLTARARWRVLHREFADKLCGISMVEIQRDIDAALDGVDLAATAQAVSKKKRIADLAPGTEPQEPAARAPEPAPQQQAEPPASAAPRVEADLASARQACAEAAVQVPASKRPDAIRPEGRSLNTQQKIKAIEDVAELESLTRQCESLAKNRAVTSEPVAVDEAPSGPLPDDEIPFEPEPAGAADGK